MKQKLSWVKFLIGKQELKDHIKLLYHFHSWYVGRQPVHSLFFVFASFSSLIVIRDTSFPKIYQPENEG